MTHAWLAITHLDEAGYQKQLKKRKEQESLSLSGTASP